MSAPSPATRTAGAGRNGSARNRLLPDEGARLSPAKPAAPYPEDLRADNRGIEVADEAKYSAIGNGALKHASATSGYVLPIR